MFLSKMFSISDRLVIETKKACIFFSEGDWKLDSTLNSDSKLLEFA